MCDLMMWWLRENRSEDQWHRDRSSLEIPPPGYTGSLAGTVWDQGASASAYGNDGDWA